MAAMDLLPGPCPATEVRPGPGGTTSEWEYAPMRIPADITRSLAATLISMQAETGGWELARVRLHADGSRRVWLRRRLRHRNLPGPLV